MKSIKTGLILFLCIGLCLTNLVEKCYENHEVKSILDVYDSIGEMLTKDVNISFPKFVSCGAQNSGKSTLLEIMTGISLPRGEGTVTKCPLVISSRNVKSKAEERGELHISNSNFTITTSIEGLEEKIQSLQTNLLESEGVEISETPIYITVYKVDSPNLTFYDLPGITYKEKAIEEKVKRILKQYTQDPNTIILFVIDSTNDLTTSEAISFIRESPNFLERTHLVLTKINLANNNDQGLSKLYQAIEKNELKLTNKPVVVRGKTPDEILNKTPTEDILKAEMELIDNSMLSNLPSENKGVKQLIEKLCVVQRDILLSSKDLYIEKIHNKISELEEKLEKIPNSQLDKFTNKYLYFREIIFKISENFKRAVSGGNLEKSWLNVRKVLHDKFLKFKEYIEEDRKKLFNDSYFDIMERRISSLGGLQLEYYLNEDIFLDIFKEILKGLNTPIRKLVDETNNYVKEVFTDISKELISNFPKLYRDITNFINSKFLARLRENVLEQVNSLLSVESKVMFTSGYEYGELKRVLSMCFTLRTNGKYEFNSHYNLLLPFIEKNFNMKANELGETKTITNFYSASPGKKAVSESMILLNVYYKSFETRFLDYFFNIIIFNYVKIRPKEFISLFDKNYSKEDIENNRDLLAEKEGVSEEREKLTRNISVLKNAYMKLIEI